MKTLKNPLAESFSTYTKPLKNRTLETNSSQWKTLRRSILERDRFTCQDCGIITTTLEVDHINSDPSNNSPANLQSLCRPCHERKTTLENRSQISYTDHLKKLKNTISKYK